MVPVTSGVSPTGVIERVDELSGRVTANIPIGGDITDGSISVGNGAVWVIDQNATLYRIDPATSRVTGRFATGAFETSILVAAAGYEWICECAGHIVLRYDARRHAARSFQYSEQPWELVGVDGVNAHGRTLWLLDETANTITSVSASGRLGRPLGLTGTAYQAVLADGSIWVAAGPDVDRVILSTDARTTIPLPKGIEATGVAVDPTSNTVWVDTTLAPSTPAAAG
jgi:streptogramin lyase